MWHFAMLKAPSKIFFWHKWEFRRFYERFDVIKQIDESGKESKSLIEILTFFPVDMHIAQLFIVSN